MYNSAADLILPLGQAPVRRQSQYILLGPFNRPSGLQGLQPFLLGFSALALVFFRGFFVKAPLLNLPEKSFLLQLAFQNLQCFFNVISCDFYIQG